ncbi:MAG TPA: PepSY-associated TM helix domain-containing protein [Cyclobacteriaceae bacterium]
MRSNKKNTIKYWIGKLHLWLGFTSGLVVFIIAITGCLYAFQVEIQNLTQSFRLVEKQNHSFLPPSSLRLIAEKELPQKKIHAVLYAGQNKAAQVIFFSFEPEYYYYVIYLNPYTGKVLHVKNMTRDFFQIVLDGHFYLWLPPSIGQPVTASATLIFVVMLITGIILWWPRNKNGAKQRFSIKWNARWRRKNYDLHNVLGFYCSLIAIVLALTGLVWGFQWFANGLYATVGGQKSVTYSEPPSDTTLVVKRETVALDLVWQRMMREYPVSSIIEVHVPETLISPIAANANPDHDTYHKTDYRYFDQHSLQELNVNTIFGRYEQADAADKLLRMNYDIHVGAILGFPGKVLAFIASLICASLPVTGVCIWWGRRNKE